MNFFSFTKTTLPTRSISNTGFSLVEVLVALAIFAVVVTMSVGTMVVMIDANAKARDTQSIVSNVAFALDSMTREIRTGYNYVCKTPANTANDSAWNSILEMSNNDATPDDCAGSSGFAFTESGTSLTSGSGSNRIGYRLRDETIERKLGSGGDWEAVTAPNIVIDTLNFTTNYSANYTNGGDTASPLVTVVIKGYGQNDPANSEFTLQTTVTQHELDI